MRTNPDFDAAADAMFAAFARDVKSPTRGASVLRPFVTPEDFPLGEPQVYDIKEPTANFMRLVERMDYVNKTGKKAPRTLAAILQFLYPLPAGINYRGSGTTPEATPV